MNNLLMNGLKKYQDEALLFARLGLCFMFVVVHGGPKLFGGPEKWLEVGSLLKVLGITTMPVFLGFIAAVSEFLGGILIGLGLFTRLGAFMIFATLVVGAAVMFTMKGLFAAAPATEDALFMLVLMAVGAGKYSLDRKWLGKD
ncbi:MAG: DoxX family protein [Sporomusaceae bacterium]|nr:DoxX family protein [Sporomusaceae bacterium]